MKQNATEIAEIDASVNKIMGLLTNSANSLIEASKVALEAYQKHGEAFVERYVAMGAKESHIRDVIRIGERKLVSSLLLPGTPGERALRCMPYEEQERYAVLGKPVEVVVDSGDGVEIMTWDVKNLTRTQAKQVFDGLGRKVRTPEEQRAWMKTQERQAKVSAAKAQMDEPYRVVGNKLIVMQLCQFTRKQLTGILAQMD